MENSIKQNAFLPKAIFYGLLTNCFIIFVSICIAISKVWYIITVEIPFQAITLIVSFDLYKEQGIAISGGITKVTDLYYTKASIKDKPMERFLTAGVFEYFSFFLVFALAAVTIMSHFKKNNILPKAIVGIAAVLALFQIIAIGVVRGIPSAFQRTDDNGNPSCEAACKHFSGSENGAVWGPSTGFHAGVAALVFSILGLFPAFLRYYYLNHHQETSYLDENQALLYKSNK